MTNLVTIDLDSLRTDLAAARARVASLEAAELAAIAYGKSTANPSKNGHPAAVNGQPTVILSPEEVAGKTVHDAAYVVLKKAEREMKTKDIVAALQAAKFGAKISNLQASVFTGLFRKKELFRKVSPGVWALAHPAKKEE